MTDFASSLLLYNAQDNVIQRRLYDRYVERLSELPNGTEINDLMNTLNLIADEMCHRGIRIHAERRKRHHAALLKKIREAEAELKDIALQTNFRDLNPYSHPQLNQFFFSHLGATPTQFSEKTGKPSLDEAALTDMLTDTNPIVVESARRMLRLRRWGNLDRNHVQGLQVFDGLAHPFWRPGGAISGRWSSSQPNVMNVPKPIEKTENGERKIIHPGLRDLYLPRFRDNYWIEVDYAQIELRIVALLAGDRPSLDAFERGEDPHSANTWDLFYGDRPRPRVVTKADVTKKERTLAKNFCYLANYGGDAHKLWKTIVPTVPEFTLRQSTILLKRYFKVHHAIKTWQDNLKSEAYSKGYVDEPLSGRRRYFWGPVKPTEVFNFPVQTAASHIINKAIQQVNARLRWEKGEGILMQLHDALHVCGPDPYRLANLLLEEMQIEINLNGQKAVFPVDLSVGKDWASVKEMSLDEIKSLGIRRTVSVGGA